MTQQELLTKLSSLHTELSQAQQVDPSTVVMLETVMADIQAVLGRDSSETDQVVASDEESPADIRGALHDLLLRIKSEHPHFSSVVEQVADGLAALGI